MSTAVFYENLRVLLPGFFNGMGGHCVSDALCGTGTSTGKGFTVYWRIEPLVSDVLPRSPSTKTGDGPPSVMLLSRGKGRWSIAAP